MAFDAYINADFIHGQQNTLMKREYVMQTENYETSYPISKSHN